MRLSKYLSLCVAMSRNQSKFFIRKGRASVDGTIVKDPDFELPEDSLVTFDGKPISLAAYRYLLLNKPPAYHCTSQTGEPDSVLTLIDEEEDARYYHFANRLSPALAGLVLLSDDARWTTRMKRKLERKPLTYRAQLTTALSEARLTTLREAWQAGAQDPSAPAIEATLEVPKTLRLSAINVGGTRMAELLEAADLTVERLQLHALGRLSIEGIAEGTYAELREDEIKP